MFDWLKGKLHKQEDYGDLRSSILNEPDNLQREPFQPEPRMEQAPRQDNFRQDSFRQDPGFDDFSPKTRDVFEPIQTPTLPGTDFDNEKSRRDYDILDRLNLIESQLAAVRSMTETINERLKNMESKLGLQRRY